MSEPEIAESGALLRDAGVKLLLEGVRCVRNSQLQSAELLLAHAWSLTCEQAPDLASRAAWERGWLAMRRGTYTDAAEWFARVELPPAESGELWSATRQGLIGAEGTPTAQPRGLGRLRVESLGGLTVWRDEQELPIQRARQPLAILRYLLTRRQRRAERDELIEAFWPDITPQVAAHRLHVSVNGLRRFLDVSNQRIVIWTAGQYAIDPLVAISDAATEFAEICGAASTAEQQRDEAAAHCLYQEAIERYTGDYHVDGHDGSWALMERERLLLLYMKALERQSILATRDQQYELALTACQKLLDRDNFREDIHCRLIRCYLALGRRAEARLQYDECVRVLASELALEPMLETRALLATITSDGGS